ncbi:MAG: carboxypeptidase-like regulatory domain-containing protein [Terracidiphilus sp.]
MAMSVLNYAASRRSARRTVLLLALSCVVRAALPQAAQPAVPKTYAPGPYKISGTVVNAVSGEPLRRASVAVLDEEDSHAIESVVSDNEGRFALTGLAAAKYQLTASKRGFRTAFFDEHDDYSTAVVTGADQDTSEITFRLTPGAVLHGQVTGDGGDPVEGARVMLFRRPQGHKTGQRIAHVDSATTDDTGAYEFGNLSAGEYLVAVTAEPWYSLHRSIGGSGGASSGSAGAKPADESVAALDVTYPVTYFDSTADESSASPISLTAGATEQANIGLHAVPALHLFVQTPSKQDESIARPELRQSIFGADVSAESLGTLDGSAAGTVEFTGVAPGHYELAQGDPPRTLEIDATANQQVDPSVGTPTVEVSGSLKSASGSALPPDITVTIEPAEGERHRDAMPVGAPRGFFRYSSVPPGKWTFSAFASGRRLAVISTTVGNRTRAGNVLMVGDQPLQIVLTVSPGDMRVEGFARKDGKGFAGAMVVLVPKDLNACDELARRDQSDSDGSFSLRDAAPGQYTVVAIEDGWNLDWSRPDVIRRFLPRGAAVTVMDTPAKAVTLENAVQVQSP